MLDHPKLILVISDISAFSGKDQCWDSHQVGHSSSDTGWAKQALTSPQGLKPVLQTHKVWTVSRFISRTRPNF